MSEFIVGGYTQRTDVSAPAGLSLALYGMMTNLPDLTSGTAASPGWSPEMVTAPAAPAGTTVMWVYGGAGAAPVGQPAPGAVERIVAAGSTKGWQGVDFDNESDFDIAGVVAAMKGLKAAGQATSYDFIAGWDYANDAAEGPRIKADAKAVYESGACDRLNLMCYGDAMWSDTDIVNVIPKAIETTLAFAPAGAMMMGMTYANLNSSNLATVLGYVTKYGLAGVMIWEFPLLPSDLLQQIYKTLGIGV